MLNVSKVWATLLPVMVSVPSVISDTSKRIGEVKYTNCPLPLVCSTWLADPSLVGNFMPSNETVPVPSPVSSRSALEVVVIVLSVITTPSAFSVVALTVVKVLATGVVPPIVVLSTVPLLTSAFDITTDPVPLADKTRWSSERVTLITLSVRLMLESIVRFETLTTPVPPGVRFKSAFELVAIMLSLKVRLSMVVVPANDDAPDTVKVESVVAPVTPSVEFAVTADVKVGVLALMVPSTDKFSFTFTVVESVALIEVPAKPMPSTITNPEPLGTIFKSSLVLFDLIVLSSKVIPGKTRDPVPAGLSTMSAFDAVELILFPVKLMSDDTEDLAYNSVKLLLILRPAPLMVSPVPSSAVTPMFISSCAII